MKVVEISHVDILFCALLFLLYKEVSELNQDIK